MSDWRTGVPKDIGGFEADCVRYSKFWRRAADLLARLPAKPARNQHELEAAEALKTEARQARTRFLQRQGYRVLRFSDREVLTDLDSVKQTIWLALQESPPP